MSKFCRVISQKKNYLDLTPLQFLHLEVLADWLTNETEELLRDFATKCEFVAMQCSQILDNESKLIAMQLNNLNGSMIQVETEVQQNEASLQKLECIVHRLECLGRGGLPPSLCSHLKKSEHEQLLGLVELDSMMINTSSNMSEIAEYGQWMQLQRSHYNFNIIVAILDRHLRILQQTEVNLDTLKDKVVIIDGFFAQILDVITAPKQVLKL